MTPQTTLAYAYLTTPDTAFDSAGVYKTDFKLMPDDAKPLLDEMRADLCGFAIQRKRRM